MKKIKHIIATFRNLGTTKKMVLILLFLFGISWYVLTNYIFYYLSTTYGMPVVSEFTGISHNLIEWFMFSLPFYFNFFIVLIVIMVIIFIFYKKKNKIYN